MGRAEGTQAVNWQAVFCRDDLDQALVVGMSDAGTGALGVPQGSGIQPVHPRRHEIALLRKRGLSWWHCGTILVTKDAHPRTKGEPMMIM
ncbi:MAG: hypothetical protein ACYCXN_06295 [Acidimicrobiales bacterium]